MKNKQITAVTREDVEHTLKFIAYLQESIDEVWFAEIMELTSRMTLDEKDQILVASILIHKKYLDLLESDGVLKC